MAGPRTNDGCIAGTTYSDYIDAYNAKRPSLEQRRAFVEILFRIRGYLCADLKASKTLNYHIFAHLGNHCSQ